MLTVLIRTFIIFVLLIFGVRLMGKRTIGELQPYEFVITLAVADLACLPLQDVSVPLLYGIVPIIMLFVIHYLLTLFSVKSIRFRKVLNGKPFIVIDGDGINYECCKKLNLSVNDLLELIRQQGYFSVPEISFGIIETNGKLSILQNDNATPPSSVPMTVIVEGKFLDQNASSLSIEKDTVLSFLRQRNLQEKDILLLTVEANTVFVQPKNKKYFVCEAPL